MASKFLNSLSTDERDALIGRLLQSQGDRCFICEQPLTVELHGAALDIDHIEPLNSGGKDNEANLAATHASCNRSKQAGHLTVARMLARFDRIRDECLAKHQRGANLGDVLDAYDGAKFPLSIDRDNVTLKYSLAEIGDNAISEVPEYEDPVSKLRYFFALLPIQYLHHDDLINPRNIGNNLGKLVTEFHKGRPQLHVSLAWIDSQSAETFVRVFDGQHKATAQVLLGAKRLPVRVFLDPDKDLLVETNKNAGTTLRQVAFDKSVQRRLGSTLFRDRLTQYRSDRGLPEDALNFSEADLVSHFKGESREMRRYIVDNQRNAITEHPENRLRDFMDYGGKGQEKPLSYNTIEKTIYSFFVCSKMLETNLDYRQDSDENPRELEIEQLVKLMNIIADEIYVDQFEAMIGTHRIENRVQKGEDIPDGHLRAFRMSKEEILYVWSTYVGHVIKQHFLYAGQPIEEDRLFQYPFQAPLWANITAYIKGLAGLPAWINRELSQTVFGGKQNYEFWRTVFQTGQSPQGQQVLSGPINLQDLIGGSTPQPQG